MTLPNPMPDPQNPDDPMYQFIDTQPESEYPATPESSLSHITVRQWVPTAITNTFPIVVTIPDNDFYNGYAIRATKFITIPFANATGMEQLNNRLFFVQQLDGDDFQLYGQDGLPVDGRSYTPFIAGGEFTVVGPTLPVVNPSHFPPPGIPIFPPI